MRYSTSRKLLEEGFLLFLFWRSAKHHDESCFDTLEFALRNDLIFLKRDFIKENISLFPFIKNTKKCGSYEYMFQKEHADYILEVYTFLNFDRFETVLLESNTVFNINFGPDLQKYQIEIEDFSKVICDKYKNRKPEHTKCKSHLALQENCQCPEKIPEEKDLYKPKKIGLSTESTVKIQRIRVEDVKKDIQTTNKNKTDKSILYVPGWSLKYDKEN